MRQNLTMHATASICVFSAVFALTVGGASMRRP